MTKAIDPFQPIHGDAPFEERMAAFNRLGLSLNAIHECIDDGFESAKASREEVARALAAYIARTDEYQGEMREKTTANHNSFLTMQGSMQALADEVTMQTSAVNDKIERVVQRVDASAGRLDKFGECLVAIGTRVGVGKEGELKPLSVWKIATTVGSALALWTVVLKLLPLLPMVDKALLQH